MSQKQHDIEVKFRKGKPGVGTRTGNNAAWLCRCEREQPLVGYSDTIQSRLAMAAAERLHRRSTANDLPRLRELLKDEGFFVREAAAWPLSELAGASALPELFRAYQRGFDEGHDNDGFSAALIELALADPDGVRWGLGGSVQVR